MAQDTSSSDWLRVLLSAFFSRMRFVLLVSLACAVAAGLSSYLLPAVYTGGFSILIKAPEFDQSSIGDAADISVRPGTVEGNVIADEYHILLSQGLAGAIADAYGVTKPLPPGYIRSALPGSLKTFRFPWRKKDSAGQREALSTYFLERVVVTPEPKSDIIKVRMEHHDRDFLEKALKLYAREYLDYRKKIWFSQDAQQFFGGQADRSLQEWKSLNEELLSLKSGVHKIDPSLEKIGLEGQISKNVSRLQTLQVELDQRRGQLAILRELAPEDAITFFNDYTKDNRLFWQLNVDVGVAKAKLQELLKNHMEHSPLVKKANIQLFGLYKEYKRLIESLVKNSISMLETEYDALMKNNEKNGGRIIDLERVDQKIEILQKNIKLFDQQYEVYEDRAMASKVQDLSRIALGASVRILSPPSVRHTPVWPNRNALVVVAAILGFFLTLIAVVSVWMMKDSFHFPEDVSGYLGLPVLTSFALESGLGDDYGPPDRPLPAKLLETDTQELPAPRSRPMGYALLVFLSMGVAGWVIGTTLWPVWEEYQQANALPSRFETAIRLPIPASSKDDPALVTVNSVTPAIASPGSVTQGPSQISEPIAIIESGDPATASAQGVESEEAADPTEVDTSVESAPALLPKVNLAVFALPSSNPGTRSFADKAPMEDDKEVATKPAQGVSPSTKETTKQATAKFGLGSSKSSPTRTAPSNAPPINSLPRYFVQFGSFQNHYRAEALRNKLAQQGYSARIPTIVNKTSGRQWFSVRADFENLDKATEARNAFLTQGGPRPVLGKQ